MAKKYLSQVIASTHLDLQGEKLSKDILHKMVDSLPSRYPLHQRHDMAMETIGFIENVMLVPDPNNDGEFYVTADVHVAAGTLDVALKGFSISTTETLAGKTDCPTLRIYLCFPAYNDDDLISSLVDSDSDLLVGKWIKKGADLGLVSLVVTGIAFALGPEWSVQYKKRIRPLMARALAHIKRLAERQIRTELVQHVIGQKDESVKLYFVPDRTDAVTSYDEFFILLAIGDVKTWLDNDDHATQAGVEMIRLYFDRKAQRYKIFHVQYSDGSDINII